MSEKAEHLTSWAYLSKECDGKLRDLEKTKHRDNIDCYYFTVILKNGGLYLLFAVN